MKRFCVIGMVLLVISLAAPPASAPQNAVGNFEAIVRVTSTAPGEAWIAGTLGTTSEGTGVLLDSMDLIVTVGYVILDIHPVKIESADGKKYPSKLLHMITIRASACRGPQARRASNLWNSVIQNI
ncbi:MAG: hypothetical protein CBC23_004035 [Rhodospirillaceae bacterium TMED63]|nr:MAG: hypothetical protein CBC23_004035 [Rhodospirillaceae bacterium TMED63]